MTAQAKTTLPNRNREAKAGWRKVKLGEVAGVLGGFAFKSEWFNTQKTGFPSVKIQNISDGSVDIKNAEYVDVARVKRDIAKFKLYKGDFLVAMTGATAGKVGLLTEETPCYLNQRVGKFYSKNEDELDKKFLYYAVINPKNLNLLKKLADGSAQGNMSSSQIEDVLEIFLPDGIKVQKRIAGILSAFDDKIELNNKISAVLEQMAQAIFKKWFVNFRFPGHGKIKMVDSELGKIPEGWEVKKLPEVFDFFEGPGIRNWQYATKGCPFINIRLIQNNDIDIKSASFISEKEANGKYEHFHLQERDMVVSTSGTLGRSAIVRKEHLPLLLNTSVIRFKPKDEQSYGFMYQFLNSAYFQNKVSSMASGSAQPNFGPVHLKQIEVLVPGVDTLKAFSILVNPVYERIIAIKSENQKLAALRDLLLPKLMSGEIKV